MKTTGYSFLIKLSLGVCLMAAYGQVAKGENMATSMLKPAAGTYSGGQWVRITSTTPGAVIRYTTDGTVPSDTVGRIYRTPVMVNRTMSMKVAVSANGYTTNNSQATYTITRTAAQTAFQARHGLSARAATAIPSPCPATSTMSDMLAMGSTGCLWGDYVYSDFSYRSITQDENGDPISPNGLPESDVTVTLSNGGGDPANPVVSLTGNWSAADCNQMGIWVEYTVTSPSTGGITGAGVSITGTVSNVDPDNQFSSYIDDAGAVGIDTGAYLPLNVCLMPEETASGPTTSTSVANASFSAQQVRMTMGVVLTSTSPGALPALQQGNAASVSRIEGSLTVVR